MCVDSFMQSSSVSYMGWLGQISKFMTEDARILDPEVLLDYCCKRSIS